MSVQANTYVIIGAQFSYEAFKDSYDDIEDLEDSPFKPDFNPKHGITCLFDGMNGKYVILGKVIAKTRDHEGFDDIIDLSQVVLGMKQADMDEIAAAILAVAPEGAVTEETPVRLMVLTHYR